MPRPQLGELHGTHMKGRKSFLTLYPTRGLSSEPSMAVGALGRLGGGRLDLLVIVSPPLVLWRPKAA